MLFHGPSVVTAKAMRPTWNATTRKRRERVVHRGDRSVAKQLAHANSTPFLTEELVHFGMCVLPVGGAEIVPEAAAPRDAKVLCAKGLRQLGEMSSSHSRRSGEATIRAKPDTRPLARIA